MSTCAKCGFALSDAAVECPACGIVLGKLRSDRSRQPSAAALPATAQPTTKGAAGVRRLVAAILPPIPPRLHPQSRRAANAFATPELLRRVARQARRVPLLVRLLRIQAALAAVLVGFALLRMMFWRSYLLQSLGEGLDLSALAELDSFVLGTRVLLEGVVVVCWLVWQRLAYDNLRAIGAKDSRFSSRAGLVYWFVPLFNLFRPYQVVHDLLVRSRSSNSLSAGDTAAARVPLLDVWWGSSIALFFSLQPTRRPHALRPEAQLPAIVLEATALIVAALAAARVVIEVDRAQRLWLEPVTQPVPLPRSEALPSAAASAVLTAASQTPEPAATLAAVPPPPSPEPQSPLVPPVVAMAPPAAAPTPSVPAVQVTLPASADESDRLPCFHCKEPARVDADVCPRCRHSLRVDVSLAGPPADRRFLQFAAKSISERLPRYAADGVKRRLERGTLVLTRLTRADAQDVLSSLRLAGVTARMTPASRRRSVGAPLARWGTAAAALLLISGAIAYRTSRARSPLSAVEIGALASASTGSLRCDDSIGSGFFVTDSRVVTNAHVVCEGEPIKVSLADGREFEGTTVAVDYRHDLAVVAVKGAKVTPLPLGDATRMRRGDEVYFFGSPKGLEFTLSKAIVSHDARQARGIPYLQLDGNVNPGNSGGPVIDQSGQVVGIVTLKVEGAEGLGFAVPVNFLHRQFEEQPLPPAADVDQEAWERRLAAAKERDDKDFAEIAPKLETGLLQAVVLNRRGELTAFELRLRPRSTARRAWVAVDFVRGERLVCSAEGYGDWLPLESVAIQWIDRETRAWLQSHDVDRRLHGAVVKLQSDSCTFADLMGVAAYVRGDREMPVPLRFAEDE